MLSQLSKEANVKQQIRRELQEKRKNEAVVAAHAFSQVVVEHLNSKVSHAYNNQKRIDVEGKKLENNATNLIKQAEQWAAMVDSFASAVKEIGDVQSWGNAIENDMKIISKTLEEAHTRKMNIKNQQTPN
uniref:Biogenesis of lysosome-related organelles complex 1 subunit 1 n=1 Tax=Panagrolaimus sp. JU765 TaxID=591449 RepID=A0AC34QH33_9BILA